MTKRSKEGGDSVVYTSDLGRSTVTEWVLRALVDKGELESLAKVRVPGAETVPAPWADEAWCSSPSLMLVSGFLAWSWLRGCFSYTRWSWRS